MLSLCKTLLAATACTLCSLTAAAQGWIADFRSAENAVKTARYAEAERLYTLVINATKDQTALTDCLNGRAFCYKKTADYDRAEADYDRAISLADDEQLRERLLYNKSELLIQTGRYRDAVDILGSIRFDSAEGETKRAANMAVALVYLKDYRSAESLIDSLLAKSETVGMGANTYATLLQNRCFIRCELNDYKGALADIEQALPSLSGANRCISLANMAMVEAELGLFSSALSHINEALAWQKANLANGAAHPDYIISLRKKAEILLKAGRNNESEAAFRSFYEAEKDYIKRNFITMTAQNRLDFWKKEKPFLSEVFALGGRCAPFLYDVALLRRHISMTAKDVADSGELFGSQLDINAAAVMKALPVGSAAVEFVCFKDPVAHDSLYAALVMTRSKISYAPIGTKQNLHGHPVAGTTLGTAVCSGAAYADAVYSDSALARIVWEPVLRLLPSNVKTLYFAPDGLLQMLAVEYLPYSALNRLSLRRVTSTSRIADSQVTARLTLTPKAMGKGSTAYQCLVAGGLSYNTASASSAAKTTERDHSAYQYALSVCGRPMTFGYISGTLTEADSIASILGVAPMTELSESLAKQDFGKYGVIHLATHGYSLQVALEEPPFALQDSISEDRSLLACGIALTGANTSGRLNCVEDDLLSAREISSMKLSGAQLVVLSACQTAQGVVTDEGPAGLVRGLKIAGAKTVVASLWSVSDRAAALFMAALYRNLFVEKMERHAAFCKSIDAVRGYKVTTSYKFSPKTMKRVKVDCSDSPVYPFKSPYYWASFIMID